MSCTGDDELDYGEEDGDAVATSFGPGASLADDEMVQDEDYEDLYDDVNIGYFQAPAEVPSGRTADAGNALGLEYNEEKAYDSRAGRTEADKRITKQGVAALLESAPQTGSEPHIRQEEVEGLKEEPREGLEQMDIVARIWSREGINHSYVGDIEERVSVSPIPASVKGEGDQVKPMERPILFSRPKDQSHGYSNGLGQRTTTFPPSKDNKDSGTATAPPLSGKSAVAAGSAQIVSGGNYETSGFASRGFPVGPGKVPGNTSAKGRGWMAEISLEGSTAAPPRPSPIHTRIDSLPNLANDSTSRHAGQLPHVGDGGGNMLFVGDLHWWTTDAELEAALAEYGRVKNVKFFEERVSGKSKGYCQVDFCDHAAAAACKQGMNGRRFHDRPCVVAFGNTRSIQDMGYAQERKAQAQFQAQQVHMPPRRPVNDIGGQRRGSSFQERESGRGYRRMATGNRTGHGQGMGSKGQTGPGRGRGNYMGKGMSSGGSSGGTGLPYGQGHSGPMGAHQTGMMIHQGIMGQGYDPGYGPPMGRGGGAAYGGYVIPGPTFSGIVQHFPSLGPGGLPGVAPHINPAFFGRSATANGIGMLPGGGMDGLHQGMWGEASMSGWAGEEHDRRARDGSYGEDGGGTYSKETGQEKGRINGGRDKINGDWVEKWLRDERDADWEREQYRERDGYKDQRDREKDDNWERDRPVRMRKKGRMVEDEEEDQRQRSRVDDYVKKRRVVVER